VERKYSKKEFESKSKFQGLRMYERGFTIYFREIGNVMILVCQQESRERERERERRDD
jgi:hypothetical protein